MIYREGKARALEGERSPARKRLRPGHLGSETLRYLVLLAFLVFFMLPILSFVLWAFKTEAEIATAPFAIPANPEWENLARAWTVGRFSRYLPNTILYAIAVVTTVCFLSCLAGYALARLPFYGRTVFLVIILVGLIVPFEAIMIPLYYLVRDLHMLGTYWAFIVPAAALGLPFGTFLMSAFFRSLPKELGDAGRIDGCGEWGVFWHVMLPLAKPGLTTLAVFQFIWTWNAFLLPLVLVQRDELRPVSLALLFFQDRFTADRGMIAAGILLTIAPLIFVYILLQRQFIEGVTAGAVK
jgi:ABC-type glycerol-3-phosphate transport system permease component